MHVLLPKPIENVLLCYVIIKLCCFRELHYQVEIVFCDKNDPLDNGFVLNLSLKNNYNTIATAVAAHLDTDPYMLQFFRNLGWVFFISWL